ncbi:MAG: AGE family epimerase/isomerase [Tetragenococcus sp.]|nr:AGE family epimerase/isomerase [Tetragenococcus sp.]
MTIAEDNFPVDFTDTEELKKQVFEVLNFYYPRCIDKENGGYYEGMLDDGSINDRTTKNLVGTARFIYIFSVGALLDGSDWCKKAAVHGLNFLQEHFLDKENNGYYFQLNKTEVADSSKMTYGHAFVLLASSIAYQAGITEAKAVLDNVNKVLENHFWEAQKGFYADEWDASWTTLVSYRGQNANMHMCEASLTAYEATNDEKYLDRAYQLAKGVAKNLMPQTEGLVWEHYDSSFHPDWDYNKGLTQDEFRPYGFIPGHQFEWSKLFIWLDKYRSEPWMLENAEHLYQQAWKLGWDDFYGGVFFALSPDKKLIDLDKNYWVMAEGIAASSLLAAKTNSSKYWDGYKTLFNYSWQHLMDHKYGGWYQLLGRENYPYSNEKSPSPKTDYHPVAAYYLAIRALS